MFGEIKCDKLRLIYEKKAIDRRIRPFIYKNLQQYFPNCLCSNNSGYILNTFNPTKLVTSEYIPEYNLEMPTEKELLEALEEITLHNIGIQQLLWTTEIHLTKDSLLTSPVNDYILMLNNLPYSYIKPELIESNRGEYSLYLTYSQKVDAEERSKFVIKFYNKSAEYIRKNGTSIYKLQKPLAQAEIRMVGSAYNSVTKTLDLSKVNWLRVEIEFHESLKMLLILKELNNKEGKLTVHTIIKALKEGSFYNTLNTIFSNILKKHVFPDKSDIETVAKEKKISGIRKLSCKLLQNSNSYWIYKQTAEDLGLQDNFSELTTIVRKVAPESELLQELKDKLCTKEGGKYISTFIFACNIFSNTQLKDVIVIYKVPILDDS